MENQEKIASCLEYLKKFLEKVREWYIKRSRDNSKKTYNKKKKGRKNTVSDHPVDKQLSQSTDSLTSENDSRDKGESETKKQDFLDSNSDLTPESSAENIIALLENIRPQDNGNKKYPFGDLLKNTIVNVLLANLASQESMKGEKYDFADALISLVNLDLSKDDEVRFKLIITIVALDLIRGKEARMAFHAGMDSLHKTALSSPEMWLVKSGLVSEKLSSSLKKLEPQSLFSEDISSLITLIKSTDDVKTLNNLIDFLRGEADIDTFTTAADNRIGMEGIYQNILIVSLEAFGIILKSYGDSSKLEVLWRMKNRIEVSFRISLVETKMFEDAMRQYLIETCKLTSTNIYPKYCRMFISLPIIKYSLLHQLDEKDRGHIESFISLLKEKRSVSAKRVLKALL